uniref:MARVEL domain-containing protein n=1 Tax=Caenorhabditis tropicalis TaxID=1561998 RepID=A0A1I7TJ06_9PELO
MHHHHHHAPFAIAGLLIIVTILTGVGTFTDYWGVASAGALQGHMGIYNWGKSDANRLFQRSPGWLQCVVVCQLMAFSFELLFCLLVVPAIIFRRMMPVHAACTLLSLIIFLLLLISMIVFAASIGNYRLNGVIPMKVGWSWGISLAATILALVLFLVSGSATGYGAYSEYR